MNNIIDLSGDDWQLKWDTEDSGISNRWYATYPSDTEKVTIPHIWERSFEKLLMSQDCAFYFKRFTISDERLVAKRIFLRFERIASHATVWLNGVRLGTHFGAYTSFIIEPQKALKFGEENVLCVRVANMGASNSRIDFGRESEDGANDRYAHPSELPVGLPWTQYPFGGIFGKVELIQGTSAYISDMYVEPDMDQEKIAIELSFNNPRGFAAKIHIMLRIPSGEVHHIVKDVKLDKENATHRLAYHLKDWKRDKCVWSLDKPNMFAVEATLEIKGTKSKEVEYTTPIVKTFSFRKFDCLKGDYYLNDSILKIQGVSYNQQWSKGGLWTTDNPDLEKDLKNVKNLGFNAIRSCGAPLSNKALDICDEIGLLVFQEFPIHTMRSTPQGLEIAKNLINDIVKEQHHHPCIAVWVLGSENGTFMLQNGNKLLNAISPVDMTRPAISNFDSIYIDNEGGFHKDTGKLLPVSNDHISQYASLRINPRMCPNANYSHFLAHCFDRDDEELVIPDTGLGDSHFQDEDENLAQEISNKLLITLKNHSLLPAKATNISGPRGAKNQKAVKTLYKQINDFIVSSDLSVWKNFEEFNNDAHRIATKSKLDQITAFQSNPQIAGFFLDQWADFGIDFSGLNDENRKTKGFADFAKEITTPSRILISELEHVVSPQSEFSFQLTLINNARYENVDIDVNLLDESGKVLSTKNISSSESVGKTSLTQLGICSMVSPKTIGKYTLKLILKTNGKEVYSTEEDLLVINQVDVKNAMKKVCFLDNSEESSDALAALMGPEQIIFTANLSSWPDEILNKIVDVTKNTGKTLLLSDMTQEDIDFMNQSHQFDFTMEAHWTTGANELSLHYLPNDSALKNIFNGKSVLDHIDAAVVPGLSMNQLANAVVFARSVSIKGGEIKTGVDLQMIPFGKGKIMFNQFNIFEGLETNPLADALFSAIVDLL